MAGQEDLNTFVREALAASVPRAEVSAALNRAGWNPRQIDAALGEYVDMAFPIPVPRPRAVLDARTAFLYFVLFSMLYVCAFNLGNVIFELINRTFPDPAFGNRFGYVTESIRWSVASLIIATPVFLFVSSRTSRAIQADPAKRGSKARRWLTYLTLSVASIVLVGDFITLVYNVLGGELTTRFSLKVLTVAAIAGGVFTYYLWDLRGDEKGGAS